MADASTSALSVPASGLGLSQVHPSAPPSFPPARRRASPVSSPTRHTSTPPSSQHVHAGALVAAPPPRSAEAVLTTELGADVTCRPDCFATVIQPDEAPRVWTASPSGAIVIRDAATCEAIMAPIEGVHPTSLCAASNGKVWVGRENGKINIFDPCGTLCTVLQEHACATAPVTLLCSHSDRVWSVAGSKDIVEWDAVRFSMVRVLFSQRPGDVVQTLCPGRLHHKFALFAGTRQRIKLWSADREGVGADGGSRSLAFVPPHHQLWSASDSGVAVYNTAHPGADYPVPLKTLSGGRSIRQLLYVPSGNRMWAFDDDQCTVYSTSTFGMLQTLDCRMRPGKNAFVSHRREVSKVWVVGAEGNRIHIWDSGINGPVDEAVRDPAVQSEDAQQLEAANAQIEYLKKKVKYIQSVGTIFRQRIGILFREKFKQRDAATADWTEFDNTYKQALADLHGAVPEPPASSPGDGLQGAGQDHRIDQLVREKETLQMALNEALSSRKHASGQPAAADVEKQIKYWKDKCKQGQDELSTAKGEIEQLQVMLHDVGPQKDIDIKRAHHICQVLREKNQLKEREQKLSEEIEKLKKQLSNSEERFIELKNQLGDFFYREQGVPGSAGTLGASATQSGSDLRGRGEEVMKGDIFQMDPAGEAAAEKEKQINIRLEHMKEDNDKLRTELVESQRQLIRMRDEAEECNVIRKQNAMLKARLKKMEQQFNAQRLDKTTEHTEMQSNMEVLMTSINQMQQELGGRDKTIQQLGADKLRLMQDISRMNTIIERYKTKVLNLEREQISRTKAEQIQNREHRRETQTLCASLDGRENKIQQLHANFVDISEQLQHQVQQVTRTNHELDLMSRENMTLKSRLRQLDVLLEERRHFSALLSEVQGRMEMAVEELKRAQSTQELAAEVQNLEQRIAGLTALEGQLKQKDDLIAVKDDEAQRLKLKLAMFERNVNNISAVFLQFPHSLEDLETLIIEVEEYRKMAGRSVEFDERVKLRQLELRSRRKQRQHQGVAKALHAGVMGSLDAATAALLARTAETDSDAASALHAQPPAAGQPAVQLQPHVSTSTATHGPASLGTPRGIGGEDALPHSSPPVMRMEG